MSLIDVINEIHMCDGDSLSEKILSFIEIHDFDLLEVADILKDSEQFKMDLYRDLVKSNVIKDDTFKKSMNNELDEW